MNRSTAQKLVGLIGHPVGHSISPQFQQAAFDASRLSVRYERWDTPDGELKRRVETLRGANYLGANVTVPHKQSVLELVDAVAEEVRLAGAANCIVHHAGRLVAHNTDVDGFRRALTEEMGAAAAGRPVAIIGAGGAARAVAVALDREGASEIVVLNRGLERARRLASEIGPLLRASLRAGPLDGDAARLISACGLIVNCTSVGLAGSADEGSSPLPAAALPPGAAVVDIVANPLVTPLLEAAARGGRPVLGGLAMLVHQGALSFELWTGLPAPLNVMLPAARAAMGLSDAEQPGAAKGSR